MHGAQTDAEAGGERRGCQQLRQSQQVRRAVTCMKGGGVALTRDGQEGADFVYGFSGDFQNGVHHGLQQ